MNLLLDMVITFFLLVLSIRAYQINEKLKDIKELMIRREGEKK